MSAELDRLEVLLELNVAKFEKKMKPLQRLIVRCVKSGLLTEDEALNYAERWATAYVDKHAVACPA